MHKFNMQSIVQEGAEAQNPVWDPEASRAANVLVLVELWVFRFSVQRAWNLLDNKGDQASRKGIKVPE